MDYQIKKVREILEGCSNTVYEIDTKKLWAKDPILMFNTWDDEELNEAIIRIQEKTVGMELVVTAECNWFDEGGTSQALIFASKKAIKRVWEKFDSLENTGMSFFIQAEYMVDLQRFPEDYILFYNASV